MRLYQVIILGIVQGLTEFLPVSSSGHLVIFQELLPGFDQPGVLLDVLLHLGTSLAVIIYFWRDLLKISPKYILLLIVGSIPAGIAGILIEPFIDLIFTSTLVVGVALLLTALFNLLTHLSKRREEDISFFRSLVIGSAQALAIIPGISRSGSTIFAGVKLGVKPKEAARFSFLLSIPAIMGANLLQILQYRDEISSLAPSYVIGFIFALLSGLLAINLVIRFLEEKKFQLFSIYAAILGIILIIVNVV